MTDAQKQKLEQQLWNIADELRGKMDADEFRDYILGFIFYKYLSEKQHLFGNRLLETEKIKDYGRVNDEEDISAIKIESLEKLGYFLRPDELFSAIARKGSADKSGESNFILEDLQAILNSIEQSTMGTESEDEFNKLFEDLDLGSTKLGRTVEARNTLIAKVLAHLNKIDFELGKVDADVLGDAYEYLIAQFASGAGKKAGEFYTPQQVSRILAKLVTIEKKRIKSAYDPTCGSGSLLLRIGKEAEVGQFFGQELNRTTYNLARMNMILHDVHFSRFNIRQEDTLEHPQHLDERFEAIVANPPFSAKWKGIDNPLNETDDRFSQYGRLAPSSKADFAFVQHIIYQLADNGTAAVVAPHGLLFRSGSEAVIRKHLVSELNYLDAVIGLPPDLFYGTNIPACILLLKKCRINSGNVIFIDASNDYEKSGSQNTLTNDHIEKIIGTLVGRVNVDKYAYVATLDEIKQHGYSLNIPRYVDTFTSAEPVDLSKVAGLLRRSSIAVREVDDELERTAKELGIDPPSGYNRDLLEEYEKGCMQRLFSGELRFSRKGSKFPDWEERQLSELMYETKERNRALRYGKSEVLSVSREFGCVNQIEHLGRSYAGVSVSEYHVVETGDIVYTKSPLKECPYGIIKMNRGPAGIVSTLYAVYRTTELVLPEFVDRYFQLSDNLNRYLRPIVRKGAKNDMKVNNEDVLQGAILCPCVDEQKRISEFLSALERKIHLITK